MLTPVQEIARDLVRKGRASCMNDAMNNCEIDICLFEQVGIAGKTAQIGDVVRVKLYVANSLMLREKAELASLVLGKSEKA